MLGLLIQITLVYDKPPLPRQLVQDDRAGGGQLARARLSAPWLNELLQDLHPGILALSLHLKVAVAYGPFHLLPRCSGLCECPSHWRILV